MVEKAIAFYKENGKQKAVSEFNNPKGQFVKGNLYTLAYNPKGTIIAHGGDPKLVGQDCAGGKNPRTGYTIYFAREFIKVGPEGGRVDYKWMNYTTNKVETKTTYPKRIDDVIIGCRAYK